MFGVKRKSVPILFLLVSCVLISGCDCDDSPEQEEGATTTLLVQNASHPVWLPDGEGFIATVQFAEPTILIYSLEALLNDEDAMLAVYGGAHNYDYTPLSDGSMIAFSTPELTGGVYVHTRSTGDNELVLQGGRRPTWIDDGPSVLAEDASHSLWRLNLETDEIDEIVPEGQFPKGSPNGYQVAYLQSSTTYSAFSLFVIGLQASSTPVSVLTEVGTDPVWSADGHELYVSQVGSWGGYNIASVDLGDIDNPSTLISYATRPSVGGNGEYLLATGLDGDIIDGTYLYRFASGSLSLLLDNGENAAAHPTEDKALVEKDGKIYLVEW